MKDPKFYPEIVETYFDKQLEFIMLYYDGVHRFKIKSLDFGFDAASIICIDEGWEETVQSISLNRLEDILLARETPPLRYIYVNRWYDEKGIPHYHGVYTIHPTLALANKYVVFNLLACPVDLVYQASDEADMFAYLADVNRNNSSKDTDSDEQMGTMDWL